MRTRKTLSPPRGAGTGSAVPGVGGEAGVSGAQVATARTLLAH